MVIVMAPVFSGGVATESRGRMLYVAPNGAPGNDGSVDRPLDLAKALSSSSPARPGDTIWLRGGTYVGNFTSHLVGSALGPIIVRQYPGERATIDGSTANLNLAALTVSGADTWYWDFEVTNLNAQRIFAGSMQRAVSVTVYGARTKCINLIVHDGGGGFGFWSSAVDAELYGNLIYNVGGEGPDRGAGHSIYTQNQTGTKRITDNILFNGFSFGIHAYTEGGAIDFFRFEGNAAFNHGVLSALSGAKANILLGGRKVAHAPVILNNYLYYASGSGGRDLDIGYVIPCDSPTIQGNYAAAHTPLALSCTNALVTGNTLYGVNIPSVLQNAHIKNTFYRTRPTGVYTAVRPNDYEVGRGHIIVYNWDRLAEVSVDISSFGLRAGDAYEVRDAQNYFGAPVLTGIYADTFVTFSMTGVAVAAPIGNAPIQPAHTDREFGVFVVRRTSSNGRAR